MARKRRPHGRGRRGHTRGGGRPRPAPRAAEAPADLTAEDLLRFMRRQAYRPLTFEELADRLCGDDPAARERLRELLGRLEAAGRVVRTRTLRYGVPERMNLVVGTLQVHPRGFGFVVPDEPGRGDVYVAAENLGGAMHGDRVVVRLLGRGGREGTREEGEVIRVLQRANRQIVGTFERFEHHGWVRPADPRLTRHDVFVPEEHFGEARDGDVVVVEITRWPEARRGPEGRVVRVLGREGAPGVDVDVIVFKHGLPPAFPPEVEQELAAIPDEVRPEDLKGRLDLRDLVVVTIDGDDAKDFDDAVSLERGRGGAAWRLGVHIADVSHYVREGSALDREAEARGTSVYLVDRVVPMLPPKLSNGICSLNPRVDRLAVSVIMDLDEDGEVLRYEIQPTVIRSRERLTYAAVQRALEGDEAERRRLGGLVPMLEQMHELAQLLRRRRLQRGAIDFDFPEPKVVLDAEGRPLEIRVERRTWATQLIEEFMILCNETVARHAERLEVPFLYRVHEPPPPDALQEFAEFVARFGYRLRRTRKPHPRALQELLERIRGTKEEYLISTVMLRSLARARYAAENVGHFGLASESYTHFTSPIRRYPDLVVHRILKELLARGGRLPERRREQLAERLPEIAQHASLMERRAEEAERESVQLKVCEYMERFLGEVFTGVVAGVTSFGLFVALPNTAEGLVHVSTMTDDYYRFEPTEYALVGERTGRVFRVGDEVRVQLVRVDRAQRQMDFRLVEDADGEPEPRGGRRRGAGRAGARGRGRRRGK